VDIAEAFGRIRANGEQGDVGREALANLAEAGEVGGVSGMVKGILSGAENVAAVAAVGIFQNARAPVAGGDVRDFQIALLVAGPPVELDQARVAEVGDQVVNVLGRDHDRSFSAKLLGSSRNRPQGWAVQVVEVSVGDEDQVNRRQVYDAQSRLAQALEDEEPACEIGIDQNVESADLHKEAGMADEGDAEFSVGDQLRLAGLPLALRDCGMAQMPGPVAATWDGKPEILAF